MPDRSPGSDIREGQSDNSVPVGIPLAAVIAILFLFGSSFFNSGQKSFMWPLRGYVRRRQRTTKELIEYIPGASVRSAPYQWGCPPMGGEQPMNLIQSICCLFSRGCAEEFSADGGH